MMLFPIFVYGTLRPGDYNHDRFPGGVEKIDSGVKANGRLYHAFTNMRGYPGARFDEDGTIIGDVLWYDGESQALRSVVSMEIGAGYSVVEIEVETTEGAQLDVIAFQYERSHGPLIASGDWFARDEPADPDLTDWAEDEYGEDSESDYWDDWTDEED